MKTITSTSAHIRPKKSAKQIKAMKQARACRACLIASKDPSNEKKLNKCIEECTQNNDDLCDANDSY